MDMPLSYLMTCSDKAAGDFAASTLNRLAELKKARRELNDRIAELEGTAQVMEYLRAHEAERRRLLLIDVPQRAFGFTALALTE